VAQLHAGDRRQLRRNARNLGADRFRACAGLRTGRRGFEQNAKQKESEA
jgi:hypothetical protein